MKRSYYKILTGLLFLAIFMISVAFAADDRNPFASSYVFHLYYDNNQLFADRDFEFKYDVIPEKFTPETYNTQFPFRGQIINFKNEVAEEFLFDPRRGNPAFLEGKIRVGAPYVPDGQKAVFYDAQGRTLLTIFVSDSSFCNDDAVCNFERGENEQTCPNDCTGAIPPPPPGSGEGDLPVNIFLLTALIVAALAVGGWYTWGRWKRVKYVDEGQFTSKLE